MAVSSTFMAHGGEGYERLMGRWSRLLAEPFLDFVGVADVEAVLDIGCGTGSLTFALAQRIKAGRIVGLDFAPAYIEYAEAHNRDPRITFQVGDACAAPFPDGAFNSALALLVLHFVPGAERAVAEMARVTRPGGVVAAAVWDARGGFVANRLFFDTAAALSAKGNERRARNYTRPLTRPGELASAWRRAGLVEISDAMLTIRMEFASFDDYWAPYIGKDGPGAEYMASLDAPERAALEEKIRLAFLDGEADGPRSYAATAWAVKGRRT
jgi:SAM-dependent methyltransferase